MTTPARPEAKPMVTVECPLCDAPVPFDTEAAALACDACGIALEVAADHAPALQRAA